MTDTTRTLVTVMLLAGLLLVLPLWGVALSGGDPMSYLHFPPIAAATQGSFSLTGFALVGAAALFALAMLVWLAFPRGRRPNRHSQRHPATAFPWWGWLGTIMLALAWMLAWSRFGWFRPAQPFTFTPLWVSYIVVINALTYRRCGHSLLTHRSAYLATLFPVSAVFWWGFEYLNRFANNWEYGGTESFTALTYAVHDSLAFSTVVPAVMSTAQWLGTFPAFSHGYSQPAMFRVPKVASALGALLAALTLAALGAWPRYFFPALWIAPLALLICLQAMAGQSTVLRSLGLGRWDRLYLPALAALFCGVWWEMWNYYSLAKWAYHIPMAERFRIFEMPVLGYSGYIPFGLECAAVADVADRLLRRSPSPDPAIF